MQDVGVCVCVLSPLLPLTGETFGSVVSFFLSFFFIAILKKEFGCLAQLVLITLCTINKIACVINF